MYGIPFNQSVSKIYPTVKPHINKLHKTELFSINPEIASQYAKTLNEVFDQIRPNTSPVIVFGAYELGEEIDNWVMERHPYQTLYFFDSRYEKDSEQLYNSKNIKVGERYSVDFVNIFDIVKGLSTNPNSIVYSFVKSNMTNTLTIDLIPDLKGLRTLSLTHRVYELLEIDGKRFLLDINKVQLSKIPAKDTMKYLVGYSRFYTDSVLIISSVNK